MSGKFDRGYRKNKLKNITKLALGDQHGIFQHFQSDVTDYPSRERYLSMRGGESTSRDRLYGIGPEHEDSYVPTEYTARSLSTRYSPNRCGVQAMRVPGSNGGVFQDPYTKKIYDYNEGFTLEDGTSFPGGSPALQTSLMGFANHLDELGLYKEANYLDSLVKRAGHRDDALSTEQIIKLVEFLQKEERPLSELAEVDTKTPWVIEALNPASEEESLDSFDMVTGEHGALPEDTPASEYSIMSKLVTATGVMQGAQADDQMQLLEVIKAKLQSDSEQDMENAGWMAHRILQNVTRTEGGRLNAFMLMLNLFLMWGGELAHNFFKSRMEDIEANFQEEGRSWFKKSEGLSKNVLEHMIKFANYLDFHGLRNEANYLDLLLEKNAQSDNEAQVGPTQYRADSGAIFEDGHTCQDKDGGTHPCVKVVKAGENADKSWEGKKFNRNDHPALWDEYWQAKEIADQLAGTNAANDGLTNIANSLDARGLYGEADFLDASIKKVQAAASLSS